MMLRATSSAGERHHPLLDNSNYSFRGGPRLAEVAGRTTAECAAVCCCCPCGLVDLLVLAVYKVPAGLCRKALRGKRRRRLMKKGLRNCSCDEKEFHIRPLTPHTTAVDAALESVAKNSEATDFEKEMFEKFYSGGFWRSSSRRSEM